MSPTILLLTGPNLSLLGTREPHVYGTDTLDDCVNTARITATKHGFNLEHVQSAEEAQLVSAIHNARNRCAAIVVNAGAFTHYSWAIHDALAMFDGVVIELHVTNPNSRENWRQTSVVAPIAHGVIGGFGIQGYELAIEGAVVKVNAQSSQ